MAPNRVHYKVRTPKILAQGQGVLQLTVVEYDIVFIDSFRFFPQKLESLPQRFQLEQFKGYFERWAAQ